jgi:hypothetical protein
MTCTEFQAMAEVRLNDAETLLAAGLWDGAYCLAGYAVECGLKANIAKGAGRRAFPRRNQRPNTFPPISRDSGRWRIPAARRLVLPRRLTVGTGGNRRNNSHARILN